MKIYKELYVGEELRDKRDDVIEKLMKNEIQWSVYLILLGNHENSQLELVNSMYLAYDLFPRKDVLVVGIAKGKGQAMELTREIVDDIYSETKQLDIRHYLLNRQNSNDA